LATRTILCIYAHPDDETSAGAALMKMYAAQGVDIHIVTATRGELGSLGTNGVVVKREDLPAVREAEQRAVLRHLGVTNGPTYLGYRDQDVDKADLEEAVGKVLVVMDRARPDVVMIHGPTGLSNDPDHIAMHEIASKAFERYHENEGAKARLFYWAVRPELLAEFDLYIDGPEVQPNVIIDVANHWQAKVDALRLYNSQADAQQLAEFLENYEEKAEMFYQVVPPLPVGTVLSGFWDEE